MAAKGVTLEQIQVYAMLEKFEDIDRLDRLAATAEGRRNAVLKEIDRHRTSLAGALREKLNQAEDAEFEVVAASADHSADKNAA